MASQSQVPEVPQEPGPSNLRIVRVKRKRNLEAPADLGTFEPTTLINFDLAAAVDARCLLFSKTFLSSVHPFAVIQDLAPKKKKPNESLADALGGLGLSTEGEGAAPTRIRPKRYRKLATMTAAEMLQMGPEKLQQILTTTEQIDPLPSKTEPTKGPASKKRSGNFENTNSGERYEQIRRRRGLTNFEVTESAVDPLRGLASVQDVVRISEEREPGHNSNNNGRNGTKNNKNSHGASFSQPTQEENQLLCNYLPMVREYLDEESQKQNSTTADDVMDTNGYVYDLYIEAETQYNKSSPGNTTGTGNEGDTEEDYDEDAWWDMHIRGGAPVVQIIDDDTWLVVEATDEEDSDGSSEDSNAEDYYGNDYPDEEDDSEGGGGGGFFFSSSDEDGGGGGIRDGGGLGYGESRRRKEWFDESDDSE
jgi:hypothetical protein